jgi:hypothetical protein
MASFFILCSVEAKAVKTRALVFPTKPLADQNIAHVYESNNTQTHLFLRQKHVPSLKLCSVWRCDWLKSSGEYLSVKGPDVEAKTTRKFESCFSKKKRASDGKKIGHGSWYFLFEPFLKHLRENRRFIVF